MIHPTLLQLQLGLERTGVLHPQLPTVRRRQGRLPHHVLLEVLRHALQMPRVAQVNVGCDTQCRMVVVLRAIREDVFHPSERLEGARGGKVGGDRAGSERRNDMSGLSAARTSLPVGMGERKERHAFTSAMSAGEKHDKQ